jgi:hypothetical protein
MIYAEQLKLENSGINSCPRRRKQQSKSKREARPKFMLHRPLRFSVA